ncbi:MAG: FAD-binding protein [Bryobacteraceae bacterium]|nr:FAD-binding protein [Bryobacteraceae bacterium]
MICPDTPPLLAQSLADLRSARTTIRLGGQFTKDRIGGRLVGEGTPVSTRNLSRILRYRPNDLTISVESGVRWSDLQQELGRNGQMIPLDPPWSGGCTVGGVVAANQSGPRRRLFGTARDCVIGMTFATLEGKLVQAGGMVVKNVAGLDFGKLMIGSWGTLAALAIVNFKVFPIARGTRTFLFESASLAAAIECRDGVLKSVLQPLSVDLLNPEASAALGWNGFALAVQAAGAPPVLDRYQAALAGFRVIDCAVWDRIREFTPDFLARHPDGVVVSKSSTLTGVADAVRELPGPVVSRAGSGVSYGHATHDVAPNMEKPGGFEIMERIKRMMDPDALLNPGRLHGLL